MYINDELGTAVIGRFTVLWNTRCPVYPDVEIW